MRVRALYIVVLVVVRARVCVRARVRVRVRIRVVNTDSLCRFRTRAVAGETVVRTIELRTYSCRRQPVRHRDQAPCSLLAIVAISKLSAETCTQL